MLCDQSQARAVLRETLNGVTVEHKESQLVRGEHSAGCSKAPAWDPWTLQTGLAGSWDESGKGGEGEAEQASRMLGGGS